MNAPSLASGSTAVGMLKSLGFIDITGVRVMSGDDVMKTVDFTRMNEKFRNRWGRKGDLTALIDPDGNTYLRYGSDDITEGPVFEEVIRAFGCRHNADSTIIADCTPGPGRQFDSIDMLKRICFQSVLT